MKNLRPRFFVPNVVEDIQKGGLLPKLIWFADSVNEFRHQLLISGIATELLNQALAKASNYEIL